MDRQKDQRVEELLREHQSEVWRQTDRMFAGLMVGQWAFAVLVAVLYSPYAWAGKHHTVHLHVVVAVVLGGAISSLPVALAILRPGHVLTRHVVAVAQMLWSAMLIHLTGGRIETHFHVFGSLAFLAFYRDWRVLVPATVVVVGDHLVRGVLWPESVYGMVNPEWWRFLEHAFWVVFEEGILVASCLRGVAEMRAIATRQAAVEAISRSEQAKSAELDGAMQELSRSQAAAVRAEKLAAVGQLAASVGHELRNPLAAVRTAVSYIGKKIKSPKGPPPSEDPRTAEFMEIIDRELTACSRIISDLLDFARERPPTCRPCPLRQLVDEAVGLVPPTAGVAIENEVPEELPVPHVDKDQFRQVLINLVQNAVEAMGPDRTGTIRVRAEGGGEAPWRIHVIDDGPGIPAHVASEVFQPLFTTKTKGTGLGLAIVLAMVTRHKGTISLDTEVGRGSTFTIELPARPAPVGQAGDPTAEARLALAGGQVV